MIPSNQTRKLLLIASPTSPLAEQLALLKRRQMPFDARLVSTSAELHAARQEKGWDLAAYHYAMEDITAEEVVRFARSFEPPVPMLFLNDLESFNLITEIVRTASEDYMLTTLRETQEALQEREDWIRLALSASDLGKWHHDLVNDVIRLDERAQQHYGIADERVMLERVLKTVHPDDVERLTSEVAAALAPTSDGRYITEYRVIHEEGSVRWLGVQVQVYFEGQGDARHPTVGFGTTQDITERKRQELDLRQSERRLRSLVDSQTAYSLRVNMDGIITYCNQRYDQQFGWYAPTLVGTHSLEMVLPEDWPAVHDAVMQCVHNIGQPIQIEVRKLAQEGGHLWTYWEFIAIQDDDDIIIQCVGFDISRQKAAEEARLASEQRYRQMFEVHGLPKLLIHPTSGRILDANPAACQFYGFAIDSLRQISVFDLSLSTEEEMRSKVAATLTQQMLSIEVIHRTAGGQSREVEVFAGPLELNGEPVIYAIITDVTERNRARQELQESYALLEQRVAERTAELRESEARFRLLAENVSDVIARLSPDGIHMYVTPSVANLVGYTPEELIGRPSFDLVHPDDRDSSRAQLLAAIAGGKNVFMLTQRILHKEGRVVWVEMTGTVVRNEATGSPREIVGVIHDITERREAQESLLVALNKEKELGELKSRFVSMASHEFRTPLASILATTETLTYYRDRMDDSQIGMRLERIRQQVLLMKDIMDDVLHLARIQAGRVEFRPQAGDLCALCHEIVDEYDSQPDYSGRIALDCSLAPGAVAFDMRLMRQTISNLLSNALKYSSQKNIIQLTLIGEEDQVVITVQDEGIGIPPDDLKHLFQPFHRAKNAATIPGTGLGLSIAKQSIEMHGGTIRVNSEMNKGTLITVRVPTKQTQEQMNGEDHRH